jgi:hypothetical protein
MPLETNDSIPYTQDDPLRTLPACTTYIDVWPWLEAAEEGIFVEKLPVLLDKPSHAHIHPATSSVGLPNRAMC